jgi:hypothetical protein
LFFYFSSLDGPRSFGLEKRGDPLPPGGPNPVHPTQRGQLEEGLDGEAGSHQRRLGSPLQRRPPRGHAQQGADLPLRFRKHQGRISGHSQRKEFKIHFSQGKSFLRLISYVTIVLGDLVTLITNVS